VVDLILIISFSLREGSNCLSKISDHSSRSNVKASAMVQWNEARRDESRKAMGVTMVMLDLIVDV
jgi:hypothetical protein